MTLNRPGVDVTGFGGGGAAAGSPRRARTLAVWPSLRVLRSGRCRANPVLAISVNVGSRFVPGRFPAATW